MSPYDASNLAEISDAELMSGIKAGREEYFQALIERHQVRIVGTIVKMLGDQIEAEDLAQQVFIRVWKSAKRYIPSAKFTTWLLTITRNLVLNEIRRRRRCNFIGLGREFEERIESLKDSLVSSPSQKLLEWEMHDMIHAAIEQLPAPQRLALIMRRYEEMPYEEIAQILGASLPAVKSMLFRAREELKRHLHRYLGD